MSVPPLHELEALATSIALEAGALLRQQLPQRRTAVETKSTATDMVSEVDRAAEALIVQRILEARPFDGFLAEEGSERHGTSNVRWVVDPLDGTTNYLYAFPAFAVSIAIEVEGEVAVGVVYNAANAELFRAVRGGGAFLGERRIAVSAETRLEHALTGTGFGYDAMRRARQGAVLARILPRIRDIRRAGSAALDLCSVACGRLDAYYEQGLAAWDRAAGMLIVTEAGGEAELLEDPGGAGAIVVAGNPSLFAGFRALVTQAYGASQPRIGY